MLQDSCEQVHGRAPKAVGALQRLVSPVALAVIVGIAYFLSARLGLVLLTRPDGVAVFWPAAGVAAGILIALGPSARWPVATGTIVATVLANLLGDRNFASAAVSALCNAGEALLVAWLIERNFGSKFALDSPRRVFGLIAAAAVSAALSGIGGTAGFIFFHSSTTPALTIWQHWFASDALGIVAIAPVLIGFASAIRHPPSMRESIEGFTAIAAVLVTAWLAVFKLRQPWAVIVPGALLYPMQLVLAARCQPVFGAFAAFIVALAVVCVTSFGLGQFFDPDVSIEDRILAAQASILVTSLATFVLSALFAERRQRESVIAESESRMRAVVNTVVDGIVTIDHQGTIENLNPAAARIFGYDPEEALGRNVRMLMPEPFRSEHDRYLRNYLRTGEAKIIGKGREVTGQRKDGSIFPLELTVSQTEVAGRRIFTGVVRDITERKRAEEHDALLRLAQASTGVGVYGWDVRTKELSVSPELEELFGLKPGSMKNYTDFRDRVHPDDIEYVETNRDTVVQEPQRFHHEFRIVRPNGETRWISSTGSAVYDEVTGEPIRILGSNFDITERKRAEERQGLLIAELDHRVKNILAQVAAVASSTSRGSRSVDAFLGSLDGRIRSMAIAHTLLSAAGWQSVGLDALVRNEFAPYATGSNATASGPDVLLNSAETQAVARVLHELATNAAKYGALSIPDGRVAVHWDVKPNGAGTDLTLVWRELGGPPVTCEHSSSYGTNLIRNLVPHELGGRVDLVFAREGVNCTIEIPIKPA
jgi:PAS domain S-box-containing protein